MHNPPPQPADSVKPAPGLEDATIAPVAKRRAGRACTAHRGASTAGPPRTTGPTAPAGQRRRRGFLLADMLVGFLVLGVLATAVAVMLYQQRQASVTLTEQRRAVRLAERVLHDLQLGELPPPATPSQRISLRPLPDGQDVPGHAWVRVRVELDRADAALVGLVPREAVP